MSTAAEITEVILLLKREMRWRVDGAMRAAGLSLSRGKILAAMEKHGPMRPHDLAQHMGHAPRSITDAIDGLERDGFVKRQAHPTDRRAQLLVTTAQGASALERATACKSEAVEQMFGELEESEAVKLLGLLRRALRSVQASDNESSRA
jgi:DNA-binding MarR family transcriptional regulator